MFLNYKLLFFPLKYFYIFLYYALLNAKLLCSILQVSIDHCVFGVSLFIFYLPFKFFCGKL